MFLFVGFFRLLPRGKPIMQSFTHFSLFCAGVRLFRCPPIRPCVLARAAEGSRVQRWREYLRGQRFELQQDHRVSMIRDSTGRTPDRDHFP